MSVESVTEATEPSTVVEAVPVPVPPPVPPPPPPVILALDDSGISAVDIIGWESAPDGAVEIRYSDGRTRIIPQPDARRVLAWLSAGMPTTGEFAMNGRVFNLKAWYLASRKNPKKTEDAGA